jgi:4'-phosphopantetheinyl transferase
MGLAGSLQYDEAHVWQMKLTNPVWDKFASVLNEAERDKTARFRTLDLQQRYSRCRSALRLILGRYVNQAASALDFNYGQFGKPELQGHRLQFNVSHSGDHALIAVSHHTLGVDLELLNRKNTDIDGMIDMVCHPMEKAALHQLSEPEKALAFYRLWTQKEAYCKMSGLGLQQAMPAVQLTATPDETVWQVRLENCAGAVAAASTHYVHKLCVFDGYAASLCLPLERLRITFFDA